MSKPFVELIKVTNNHFLYDVNSNKVAHISKQLSEIILKNDNLSIEELLINTSQEVKNEILSLINCGMLKDNKPCDIEHPATIFLKSYTENYVESLTLQVTQSCNLRCRYCGYSDDTNLERKHSNSRMSWEIASKSLDFYSQHSSLSQEAVIAFYGGEPLLEFSLIEKVVAKCEQLFKHKKRTYKITTNCTFLTDKMIAFFNTYNFIITVSLDGPENIHNKNRKYYMNGKGTYESVIKNFEKLKNGISDYKRKLNINAVIDMEENYSSYLNFFDLEYFKGLKIELNPIDYSKLKYDIVPSKDFQHEQYTSQVKSYLQLMKCDNILNDNLNIALQKVIRQVITLRNQFSPTVALMEKEHHSGPCVPGYSCCFVNVDGIIFPCEKVSEISQCMRIGNIDDGYDYNKMETILNIGKITKERCLNCTAIRHCSICGNTIDDVTDFNLSSKLRKCQEQKLLFKKQLEKYILVCQMGLIQDGIINN